MQIMKNSVQIPGDGTDRREKCVHVFMVNISNFNRNSNLVSYVFHIGGSHAIFHLSHRWPLNHYYKDKFFINAIFALIVEILLVLEILDGEF